MTSAALVAGNTVIVKPAGPTPVIAAQLVPASCTRPGAPAGSRQLPARPRRRGRRPPGHAIPTSTSSPSPARGRSACASSRQAAQHPGARRRQARHRRDGRQERDHRRRRRRPRRRRARDRRLRLPLRRAEVLGRLAGDRAGAGATTTFVQAPRRGDPQPQRGPARGPGHPRRARHHRRRQGAHRGLHRAGQARGRAWPSPAEPPAGGWPDDGFFVGPHIFVDVPPDAVIAQEEIFGPVVAVHASRATWTRRWPSPTARATRSPAASSRRSPATIARVRREFRVGNLYINRGITGALVERQPFGGFKMSGIGSKAGGPDYLLQFMDAGAVADGDSPGTPLAADVKGPTRSVRNHAVPTVRGRDTRRRGHAAGGQCRRRAGRLGCHRSARLACKDPRDGLESVPRVSSGRYVASCRRGFSKSCCQRGRTPCTCRRMRCSSRRRASK